MFVPRKDAGEVDRLLSGSCVRGRDLNNSGLRQTRLTSHQSKPHARSFFILVLLDPPRRLRQQLAEREVRLAQSVDLERLDALG